MGWGNESVQTICLPRDNTVVCRANGNGGPGPGGWGRGGGEGGGEARGVGGRSETRHPVCTNDAISLSL